MRSPRLDSTLEKAHGMGDLPYILTRRKVAAICVREVRAVQYPNGEANLEFGKEFWRVYWGLVDKEEESAAPPRRTGITRKQPPSHQRRKTAS